MNIKKASLAAAISVVVGLSAASQATAGVYARSYLKVENMDVVIFDPTDPTGDQPLDGPVDFNMTLTNTAFLNGPGVAQGANCGGTPGVGNNDCSITEPQLDALPATLGSPARTNNDFSFLGPTMTDTFSNADSVIYRATLVEGPGSGPTSFEQIAESQLAVEGWASANSEIVSGTGMAISFAVASDAAISIEFDALWDRYVEINDPLATFAIAESNSKFRMTLTNDDSGLTYASWVDGSCSVFAPLSCVDTSTGSGLDADYSVSTDGTNAGSSGGGVFGLLLTGLTEGNWTLNLNVIASTSVTRVTEPATLALLGIGLLGVAARRRAK